MYLNKIIAYVEGNLSEKEKKQIERFIFADTNNITIIGSLNHLRKSLSSDETLTTFFQRKSEEILSKININDI